MVGNSQSKKMLCYDLGLILIYKVYWLKIELIHYLAFENMYNSKNENFP